MKIDKNYISLFNVLNMAYKRASEGKGKDRHAEGKPFTEQDILKEQEFLETNPIIYQIRKKAKESLRLSKEAAMNEFLDIIVYAAAAYIFLSKKR